MVYNQYLNLVKWMIGSGSANDIPVNHAFQSSTVSPSFLRYLFQSKHWYWLPVDTINGTFYPVVSIGVLQTLNVCNPTPSSLPRQNSSTQHSLFIGILPFPLPDRDNSFPFLHFLHYSRPTFHIGTNSMYLHYSGSRRTIASFAVTTAGSTFFCLFLRFQRQL